jgi:DNA-binding MarR family transcriptional regulator
VDTDPALQDERLTTFGLLAETWIGLQSTLERLLRQECGLSTQWFEVLLRLARSPGQRLRMCDLAAQVSMSPSGLTRAVDRLESLGYVTRRECPTDRRGQLIVATADGRRAFRRAAPIVVRAIGALFAGQFSDDIATLRVACERIAKAAEAMTP